MKFNNLVENFFYFKNIFLNSTFKVDKLKKKYDKIYVFGSGKSILEIDKKIINKIDPNKVIFMNRNIIFHEIIGIWPSMYFLSDTNDLAKNVFRETLRIIIKNKKIPTLFLNNKYKNFFFNSLRPVYFKSGENINLKWSNNLNDKLFSSRGSLTTLLNLLLVLDITSKIILIGVDLDSSDHFFYKEKKKFPNFFSEKEQKIDGTSKHPNMNFIRESNILTNWNIINKKYKEHNIELFCCNKKSALVKNKFVKYTNLEDTL